MKQKDKIQELRQEISDANRDINDTKKALDELRLIRTVEYGGLKFTREPTLSDYYKPSDEMKEYQMIFIEAVGLDGGYVLHKFI